MTQQTQAILVDPVRAHAVYTLTVLAAVCLIMGGARLVLEGFGGVERLDRVSATVLGILMAVIGPAMVFCTAVLFRGAPWE